MSHERTDAQVLIQWITMSVPFLKITASPFPRALMRPWPEKTARRTWGNKEPCVHCPSLSLTGMSIQYTLDNRGSVSPIDMGKFLRPWKYLLKKAQLAFRKWDSLSLHTLPFILPPFFSLFPSYHIGNPLALQDFSEWQNHWPQMAHCLTSGSGIRLKEVEKPRGLRTSHMPCSVNPHERALVKWPG